MTVRRRRARLLAPLGAVGAALACAAVPMRYSPSLESVSVPPGIGAPPVTALVSIAGAIPGPHGKTIGIEVRMRLENHGDTPAVLEPDRLKLVLADLETLGPPELLPEGAIEIPPGGEVTVTARFAFPPESEEPGADALRALNLRFDVDVAGRSYASSATFDRQERQRYYYYPPYAYGYWGWPGFAAAPVVVVHHHHG